jgi:hypothetical protein
MLQKSISFLPVFCLFALFSCNKESNDPYYSIQLTLIKEVALTDDPSLISSDENGYIYFESGNKIYVYNNEYRLAKTIEVKTGGTDCWHIQVENPNSFYLAEGTASGDNKIIHVDSLGMIQETFGEGNTHYGILSYDDTENELYIAHTDYGIEKLNLDNKQFSYFYPCGMAVTEMYFSPKEHALYFGLYYPNNIILQGSDTKIDTVFIFNGLSPEFGIQLCSFQIMDNLLFSSFLYNNIILQVTNIKTGETKLLLEKSDEEDFYVSTMKIIDHNLIMIMSDNRMLVYRINY